VLAAGATLHRLAAMGAEIHVAIPATGIHSRRSEDSKDMLDAAVAELRVDCANALGKIGIQGERIYFGEFADKAN